LKIGHEDGAADKVSPEELVSCGLCTEEQRKPPKLRGLVEWRAQTYLGIRVEPVVQLVPDAAGMRIITLPVEGHWREEGTPASHNTTEIRGHLVDNIVGQDTLKDNPDSILPILFRITIRRLNQ
jgi:hypothetical protein